MRRLGRGYLLSESPGGMGEVFLLVVCHGFRSHAFVYEGLEGSNPITVVIQVQLYV